MSKARLFRSRFAAAERLLRHGADVNFQSSKGVTALHLVLRKNGKTPLDLVAKRRDRTYFDLLSRRRRDGSMGRR